MKFDYIFHSVWYKTVLIMKIFSDCKKTINFGSLSQESYKDKAFEVLRIKEFTSVNGCFQNKNNAVFGVFLQRLFIYSSISIAMLFGIVSCANKQKSEGQTNQFSEIQGWNILSDNEQNALEVIDAAKKYNINHLQLSHHIVHDLKDAKDERRRKLCNNLIQHAHKAGIEEVLVWDHALYSLDYYPKKYRTGPDSTINLDNPEFWEWFREDYRSLLKLVPEVDGIILTFIETGARVENQFSESMKTPAEKLARVIDEVAEVVINEQNLKLYARTFIYTREELSDILDCIDLIQNEEVLLMVKEVPHDFYLTHPVQNYIDRLERPVLIEFDAGHEYSGQGIIANTFVEKMAERWRYYQQFENVIGYVARTDRYGDTKIINRPSEIQLYAFNALNENPEISDDEIYDEYIGAVYGTDALPYLKPAFQNAYDIVTSSLYTLGLCMANHSYLSCDYQSVYNRYVSGRWMDNPVFYLSHDVNKEFHYYTDVVNHLAPAHLKTKDSRLFEEDPFLLETDWIIEGELMNAEYLGYVIAEKDYGVNLAIETLKLIEESKAYVSESQFEDLYQTFYRTLVKARLSRGACKAYFSYRILANDISFETQDLLDVFWQGIDEMLEMKEIVINEFQGSPEGQWNWEQDMNTVDEYVRFMTRTGWEDYNNHIIDKRKL